MADKAGKADRRLLRHTHAQYVALRDNEDRLIGERFTALLFASSFLAVVWATGDSLGLWGRLAVAALGLIITLLIWRMNFRGAQAAEDWRSLAIEEEKELYGHHPCHADLSSGPYGRRVAKDQDRGDASCWEKIIRKPLEVLSFQHTDFGRTNIVTAWFVPLVLVLWWTFAMVYTFHHEFKVTHAHEVTDSVGSEADQTTPNHPN